MKKTLPLLLAFVSVIAGCSGISKVGYNRFDRGRKIVRVAVVAYDQTVSDRHRMWAWATREKEEPEDTFAGDISKALSAQTEYHILSEDVVEGALRRLNLEGREVFDRRDLKSFRRLTGADVILFANVSFYLQNYLFYKTFGLVEISMRLVSTWDGALLWDAKGRNFALFITTDGALARLRNKMVAQAAHKLEGDKGLAI